MPYPLIVRAPDPLTSQNGDERPRRRVVHPNGAGFGRCEAPRSSLGAFAARSLGALGLGVALLAVVGCLEVDENQRDVPVVDVAVGARIELHLEWACSEQEEPELTRCLSSPPDAVESVELRSGRNFELHGARLEGRGIFIDVEARGVGDDVLEVVYEVGNRRALLDRFELRAAEISHVEAELRCDHEEDGLTVYPMPPGAEVDVRLQAHAGDRVLASGQLELLTDAGPFSLDPYADEDGYRTARAPEQPGLYTWQLVGRESATVEFPVYVPGEAGVALLPAPEPFFDDDVPGFVVTPGYEGTPSCKHDGYAVATVEVIDGPCRPIADAFELEGAFVVDISEGPLEIGVAGVGECTVLATDEDGRKTERTFAIAPWEPPASEGSGARLSSSPTDIGPPLDSHASCRRATSVGSGSCDVLDAAGLPLPNLACLSSWDWKVQHRDGTERNLDLPPDSNVGVGLRSELHAFIEYEVLGLDVGTYPPSDLSADAESTLGATNEGCVDEKQAVVDVLPTQSGDFAVALSASNINKGKTVQVRARDIAATIYETDVAGAERSTGTQGQTFVFTGLQTVVQTSFEGDTGETLYGTTPIVLTTDAANAGAKATAPELVDDGEFGRLTDAELFTGIAPNVITIGNDATDHEHRYVVVGVGAIADVEGLSDTDLRLGASQCVEPRPITADGERIYGAGPTRPLLQLDGPPMMLDLGADRDTDEDGSLCFIGYDRGAVEMSLAWGDAQRSVVWTVD